MPIWKGRCVAWHAFGAGACPKATNGVDLAGAVGVDAAGAVGVTTTCDGAELFPVINKYTRPAAPMKIMLSRSRKLFFCLENCFMLLHIACQIALLIT